MGSFGRCRLVVCASALLIVSAAVALRGSSPNRYYVFGPRTWDNADVRVLFDPWYQGATPQQAGALRLTNEQLSTVINNAIEQWRLPNTRLRMSSQPRAMSARPIDSCDSINRAGYAPGSEEILIAFDHSPGGDLLHCSTGKSKKRTLAVTLHFDQPQGQPTNSQLLKRRIVVVHASEIESEVHLQRVIAHELGHAGIGLDHSLVELATTSSRRSIMSPVDNSGMTRTTEDEVSELDLYPLTPPTSIEHGWIEGRVVEDSSGRPQPNVAVIVVDAEGHRIYSAITRSQLPFDATVSQIGDTEGRFRVAVLPGTYKLKVESISDDIKIAPDAGSNPFHPRFNFVEVREELLVKARAVTLLGSDVRVTLIP